MATVEPVDQLSDDDGRSAQFSLLVLAYFLILKFCFFKKKIKNDPLVRPMLVHEEQHAAGGVEAKPE